MVSCESVLPYERKHPIILPYKSPLADLVISKARQQILHGGNTLTLESIRQRFWILNGLKAVKAHIHKCVKCHRQKAEAAKQLMGMLSKDGVTISPPFFHSGVIHLGVATEPTLVALLAAFKPFVARRGSVAHIYGDNATNFIGASKILVKGYQHDKTTDDVIGKLQRVGTESDFNTPASLHFGRLWEAGVKSMKHHLRRVSQYRKISKA
ncbi:unnamed protein product [Hermetia illucens]|uniref:Integrase zinc-binding domain-containing protein n=1 Tax=Hermetia illucens TaxID=343691 RepID=A0A7R8UNC1_HERIL|nr:unnamed protein product [Hermetia illucens]